MLSHIALSRAVLNRTLGLAIGLLACTGSVSAQMLTLPEGTVGLSPIEGRLATVEHVRTPGAETATASETRVTLEFVLQGCLDSLMPLITHHEMRRRRVLLYVTAFNAHDQRSETVRCFAIPRASAQVSIPGVFQRNQIQVIFMGQPSSSRHGS
jgi:hypothetical protein